MNFTKTTLGAASLLAAAVFAGPAFADGISGRGRIASSEPARTCTTAGTVGVTSDYVFRGISQTDEEAAIQGGVDFTCGRFYFGFAGSNVDFDGDANVEIDLYAGIKGTSGRFGWDLGVIYYGYPGQDAPRDVDFFELKAAGTVEVWKGGTLGGTVFFSPEYTYETGEVTTVEASFSQALPKIGIFTPTVSALIGHSEYHDSDFEDNSYTYWNAGVTLGFHEKWSVDLRYHDTDGEGAADTYLADERFVGTLKYSF